MLLIMQATTCGPFHADYVIAINQSLSLFDLQSNLLNILKKMQIIDSRDYILYGIYSVLISAPLLYYRSEEG